MNFETSFKQNFNKIRRTSALCGILCLIAAVSCGLLMPLFEPPHGTPLEKMLNVQNLLLIGTLSFGTTFLFCLAMFFAAKELSYPKFKATDQLFLKPSGNIYYQNSGKAKQIEILGIQENCSYLIRDSSQQNNSMSFSEAHTYYYLPKK